MFSACPQLTAMPTKKTKIAIGAGALLLLIIVIIIVVLAAKKKEGPTEGVVIYLYFALWRSNNYIFRRNLGAMAKLEPMRGFGVRPVSRHHEQNEGLPRRKSLPCQQALGDGGV